MADALERVTSLTSLNGCGQYAAILAGGLAMLKLEKEWELGLWAACFLERSNATLTALDVRWSGGCGVGESLVVVGGGQKLVKGPPLCL